MPNESTKYAPGDLVTRTLVSALPAFKLGQAPDGRAFAIQNPNGYASGDQGALYTSGTYLCQKASGFVALAGLPAYWDAANRYATYWDAGGANFYCGVFVDDALSADSTCLVALNERRRPKIDLLRDPSDNGNLTGTQALGGFLPPQHLGGKWVLKLSATNEQQTVDLLSQCGFKATGAAGIVRLCFNVVNNGAAGSQWLSLGVANASHATDPTAVSQYLLVRLAGGSTAIKLASKDGTTTIGLTDTTKTLTVSGTLANRVEVWIDFRNPADVQCYVNGANVLPATVFNVANAASEWKLLAHLTKGAGADVYQAEIHAAEVYTADERDVLAF